MRPARNDPLIGLLAQLALLAALAGTVGLGPTGWVVGTACGVTTYVGLTRGLARHGGGGGLRPADRVTLTRATIVGAVAALVADSFSRPTPVTLLVALTVVALLLDAIDGWLARRTASVTTLGARFDLEVDAFLILVLSVYVARSAGAWVLAIGAARYLFVGAGWLLPWLRGTLPPRRWCKVVAATQGVVLATTAAAVLPPWLASAALGTALVLLAESFGREVWGLWALRPVGDVRVIDLVRWPGPGGRAATGRGELGMKRLSGFTRSPEGRRRLRPVVAGLISVLACLLVWLALVAPNELSRMTPGEFLRIPLEGLLVVALVLVLPVRAGLVLAVLAGLVLGLLTIVKVLDMAFYETLGRRFNPATDGNYVEPALDFVRDEIGGGTATAAMIGLAALAVGVLVVMPLAVLRVTRVADRHRDTSVRAVVALGVVWVVCAVAGLQIVPGAPLASTSAAGLASSHVTELRDTIQDREVFAKELAVDRFEDTPDGQLLTGLRGKDVLLVFVESYGRVAVEGSDLSAEVDSVLDAGTDRLRAAGFSSRSAFLTSPTFGAGSWLAHATLQSGLWIDNELRYADLFASDRLTLSDAFKSAGWRTVGTVPANDRDWPEGTSFYDWDALYDSRNVGYAGPEFSYASMPDQYTLSAFRRLELAERERAPVMAEIDLVSSHNPWTPVPRMIDWSKVGDGSVFDGMPGEGQSPDEVWPDPDKVQTAYGQTIEYSLNALISYVQTYPDDDLVLVVLGDHQPATIVSGSDAGRDVPITIIAHDPDVMDRMAPWGWQDGMNPDPDAPVWPMDEFRDRFLTAYGPHPPSAPSVPSVTEASGSD